MPERILPGIPGKQTNLLLNRSLAGAGGNLKGLPILELFLLALVPVGNGSEITADSGIDFCFCTALCHDDSPCCVVV